MAQSYLSAIFYFVPSLAPPQAGRECAQRKIPERERVKF